MADRVHPEDQGISTDLESGWIDAAVAGQLAYSYHSQDVVITGLDFTVDYAAPSVDVSAGAAKITTPSQSTVDHSGQTPAEGSVSLSNVSFAVEADARSGVSLTDTAINYIYLQIDLSTQNGLSLITNTTGSRPAEPVIKLGQIDTDADTKRPTNRGPRHEDTFDFSSVSFPVTVDHNIGEKYVSNVQFYDSSDVPFGVTWGPVNEDQIEVDTTYTSTGTYVVTE